MPNLETSIAEWRRQMLAAGIKAPGLLDELEGHLREEMASQMSQGLSELQAFELAVASLGRADLLQREFKKAGRTDKAQLRRRAGFACAGIYGFYSLTVVWLSLKNDLTLGERLSSLASVATLLAAMYASWQILPRFFPVIMNKIAQSAIGILGGVSGITWFAMFVFFILPRYDFTTGQLLVATFWAMVPLLVSPAIGFMVIDKSERSQAVTMQS